MFLPTQHALDSNVPQETMDQLVEDRTSLRQVGGWLISLCNHDLTVQVSVSSGAEFHFRSLNYFFI